MMSYYDGVLLAIPTIMLAGATISHSIGISTQLSMALTSGIGLAIIIHGLVIRPPTPHTTTPQHQQTKPESTPNRATK